MILVNSEMRGDPGDSGAKWNNITIEIRGLEERGCALEMYGTPVQLDAWRERGCALGMYGTRVQLDA